MIRTILFFNIMIVTKLYLYSNIVCIMIKNFNQYIQFSYFLVISILILYFDLNLFSLLYIKIMHYYII